MSIQLSDALFLQPAIRKVYLCCMAKKNNKQQKNTGNVAVTKPLQQPAPQKKKNAEISERGQVFKSSYHVYIAGAILVVTYLFLKNCLGNLFTNWDDPGYVVNNPLIKNITSEGIKNIFSPDGAVMGNYHPLTILSYAIEYSFVRLEPWQYHFDSLTLHLLCTLLVYWFVSLLSRRPLAGAVAALLFGLHPMHVESVAWVAGRKDVLYGAFYLAACITYVYGLRSSGAKKWLFYAGTILLFVCSLLAKPVAVSLPLVLLLIDYFEQKLMIIPGNNKSFVNPGTGARIQLNYWLLLEKIPYFGVAILFGIRSLHDQKKFGALNTLDVVFNPLERIALGCYALVTYLFKAIVPIGLSCFYPYPLKVNGALPWEYYSCPIIVIALLFLVIRFAHKNKAIVFGLLFFLVNIGLLLQFIPVGGAILADRYTYIPYIGLFFIAGWFVSLYFETYAAAQKKYWLPAIVLIYCCCLGYISSERSKVWYNAVTLWRNEIDEHATVPNAYNNLGFFYFNEFNDATDPREKKNYYDSSYLLLNQAIALQPNFVNPYISLGELQRSVGSFDSAKRNYYKALSLNSNDQDANAYLGLAIIYAINHNNDSSAYCFRTALKLKPYFPEAHSNFGNFLDMNHKYDSALAEYTIAIAQNPDTYPPYLNRGRALQRLNKCDQAFSDFEKALEISPDNGEVYYARSYCYTQKGNKALALKDVEKALALHFTQVDPNYYQMLKSR